MKRFKLTAALFLAASSLAAACSDGSGDDDGLVVSIVSPDDGDSFLTNAQVHFRCRAATTQGVDVPTASYKWEIQPAGVTLIGPEASSRLVTGEHKVVCIASEPDSGLDGDAEITITVGDAVVAVTLPEDGSKFKESSAGSGQSMPITFTADGNSLTGGGGTYSWDIGPTTGLMGQTVQTSLPVGVHDAVVTYTDSASNTAKDSVNIEVLTQEEWNACLSGEEICNSIDDNCNGNVDEGHISCGVGACMRQVQKCENGEEGVCVPGDPAAETCNGKDDDCDGTVDEHDGDTTTLCQDEGDICANGECQSYEIPEACTMCPCDQCEERQGNRGQICCEFEGIGSGIICIDAERAKACPAQ